MRCCRDGISIARTFDYDAALAGGHRSDDMVAAENYHSHPVFSEATDTGSGIEGELSTVFFDPLYLVMMAPAIIFVMVASHRVKSTFNKYAQVRSHSGLTGAQVATEILRANNIYDVEVERVPVNSAIITTRALMLRLSDPVYGNTSVAAIGVAAHEVGHAIQHARGYVPLKLRSAIVPVPRMLATSGH